MPKWRLLSGNPQAMADGRRIAGLDPARSELLARVLREEGVVAAPRAARRFKRAAPLSPAQERLWFLDQLEPGNTVYHISRALRLRGKLDYAALDRALEEIIRRHEILRTSFPSIDDRPVQQVAPHCAVSPTVIDLQHTPEPKKILELRRLLAELAAAPFDLQRGPLMRGHLLRLGARDHLFLLTLHQIICDGWSMNLLLRELAAFYEAARRGETAPLRVQPAQYGNYARAQRAKATRAVWKRQLAFWRSRLEGAVPGIALPADRPRPPVQSFRGARLPLSIPAPLVQRLKAFGRKESATPFMVFMAAFNALLWRYSGQEDISVGVPVAQRDGEFPDSIGLFVNTLVLRSDLSGAPSFRGLLRGVREQCRHALAHRDVPFDLVVEELQRERDLSRNPLFQVMFAYQNYAPARFAVPGLHAAPVELDGAAAKFDLMLSLTEHGGARVDGFLEYATDLFDRPTAQRMARHLIALLRGVVAHPEQTLATIPLLDKRERRRLLVDWNRTNSRQPRERCIHRLFEAQAKRTPRAVAVEYAGRRLTYDELNRRANRLARFLHRRGMGPEKLAAVCLDRSLEMVVALLAVLKSGGAYLPIDPKYPAERIAFMLEDSRVEILLTTRSVSGVAGKFAKRHGAVVCLDAEDRSIAKESSVNPSTTAHSDNLAYVIYTSGSTGEPKGVAIEHRNAAAFLDWTKSVFTPAEMAGVLASTSICFDLSVFELFATWNRGGKVILVESALALTELGARSDITLVNTVPSAMRELLAAGALPRSVRTVNLAGEALTADLVRQIYALGAVDKVYDLYGPSETTTYSTFALRKPDAPATIGRPIANTRVYVLDAAMQPVPVGVAGEIFIGGAGVARGYLRRPQLTEEKFLRDPFAGRAGARMYRTGDLARFRADGSVEYLGRADGQIKLRGYRVELGEIEAVLARHPAVRECAVIAAAIPNSQSASENLPAEKRLLACVAEKHGSVGVSELRSYLRGKLPEYMVPAEFVALDALPLTPNGKIDRLALAHLTAGATASPAQEFVPPRGELEEHVAQVWRAALGVERVGAQDDFFEIGGHSLLAVRVAARLRAALEVELPLRTLFEARTVAELAREIEARRQQRGGIAPSRIPRAPSRIPRAPSRDRMPLSFAQRRLWFLRQLDPGLTVYNMPAAYRVRGQLRIDVFERALNQLVERHASLRTAILDADGEPVQQVAPSARLALARIDLSRMAAARREREIARLINEDAEQPYDFAAAPLMRATILVLGKHEHVLLVNFHHIICDGSSLAVFYRELAALYEAEARGAATPLPELPLDYVDYAVWQRRALEEGWLESQLAYWRRQLGGAPAALELPMDGEHSSSSPERGGVVSRCISDALSAALERLARREQATPFMIFLSAFNILLARLSGASDIVVGSTIVGRHHAELEGLVGFFINALALRSDLSGDPRFVDLLRRVRQVCLDAYSHQDAPFELVVEALRPERVPRRNPIFQVLFNMGEIADRELQLAGCAITRLRRDVFGAKFDLVASANRRDGVFELTLTYDADLFRAATAQVMVEQWIGLLEQIGAEPEKHIEQFSLSAPSTAPALPDPTVPLDERWRGPIHLWFARRAKENPKKIAVTDDEESWTYRDLERTGAQLAERLRRDGLRPKDVVAIYAHRDASLALALLGVLRAGGVFVILDPSYPPARLVEYLRLAEPAGMLVMEGAGALPAEIESHLHDHPVTLRMTLPRARQDIRQFVSAIAVRARTVKIGADDLAYIAFTSGSTGEPKAVLARHGPMTYFLPWQSRCFDLKSDDRYALTAGLGYNHLQRDLFTALALGATLQVPAVEDLRAARRLARWLADRKISVLHLTPALGRFLQTADISLPSLKRAFFGGDRLLWRDIAEFAKRAPRAQFASFYGATETQRAVGVFAVDTPRAEAIDSMRGRAVPIGKGAPGVQLLILNNNRRLAGVGEVGELYVRSPHLAAGYVGDRALTEARFIGNPFTGEAHDRLYRTGESARYQPDGNIEWLGRNERRASIRGFRVELAEVERVLGECPGVGASAVAAESFDGRDGEETRLIAYVEQAADREFNLDALHESLNVRLPSYMIPSVIHRVQRMPLNPNGKIDYPALARAERIAPARAKRYEPAKNARECAVERIFAEVLGLERVGRGDNFFALGGHSLLLAKIAARLRETLGIELDLRAFFDEPTIAGICRRLDAGGEAKIVEQCAEREEFDL